MTNLDDVSYDRLILKRCGVAPESTEPEDKLLNVIVCFMTLWRKCMTETRGGSRIF